MDETQPETCYVEQRLKVNVPGALWDSLVYGKPEIKSSAGYRGGAVEVKYPNGKLAGTLVYFPGVSADSL